MARTTGDVPRAGGGLAAGSIAVFAIHAAGIALGYAAQVAVARWLGAAGYGVLAYANGWALFLAGVLALGAPAVALRFVAEYVGTRRWDLLQGLEHTLRRTVGLGCLVGVGLGLLALALLPTSDTLETGVIAGIVLAPALVVASVYAEALRGAGKIVSAFAPLRLGRPILLLALAWLLGLLGRITVRGLLTWWIVATYALTAAVAAHWWFRVRRPNRSHAVAADRDAWRRAAVAFVFLGAVNAVLTQADLLIMGILADEVTVGIFNAATRTASLLGFFAIAVIGALAPRIASLHATGDTDLLRVELRRGAHFAFWPTALTGLGLWLAAPRLLALFGGEFSETGPAIVRVLIVGHVVSTAIGPVGYVHNLTGHERVTLRILAAAAAFHIVLSAVLISTLGAIGGALAWTATTITWHGLLLGSASRVLGLNPGLLPLPTPAARP